MVESSDEETRVSPRRRTLYTGPAWSCSHLSERLPHAHLLACARRSRSATCQSMNPMADAEHKLKPAVSAARWALSRTELCTLACPLLFSSINLALYRPSASVLLSTFTPTAP
eukprot:scaffold69465_cov38-Tisochrysis_lutea.AAC.4